MERPSLWRASAEPGVGCARPHGAPVQTVCRRVECAGSMARKSATSRVTTHTHASRARMRLEPDKRICASLETTPPLALFPSVSGRFMLLSLTQERRKTQRLRERFLSSSAISYHIIPPSRKRDEWLDVRDVCSRCGLLCTHLGGWFNSRSRPKKTCGTGEQFAASKHS